MSGLGEHHGDHAVDAADVTLRSGAWPRSECVEPRCLHPAETGAPADPGWRFSFGRARTVGILNLLTLLGTWGACN
ncbi:MAG: hypothetical protein IH889_00800 [Planctomycetes bacterium]|nr:hypothetical protein [Planctomycetota bacterium]